MADLLIKNIKAPLLKKEVK